MGDGKYFHYCGFLKSGRNEKGSRYEKSLHVFEKKLIQVCSYIREHRNYLKWKDFFFGKSESNFDKKPEKYFFHIKSFQILWESTGMAGR